MPAKKGAKQLPPKGRPKQYSPPHSPTQPDIRTAFTKQASLAQAQKEKSGDNENEDDDDDDDDDDEEQDEEEEEDEDEDQYDPSDRPSPTKIKTERHQPLSSPSSSDDIEIIDNPTRSSQLETPETPAADPPSPIKPSAPSASTQRVLDTLIGVDDDGFESFLDYITEQRKLGKGRKMDLEKVGQGQGETVSATGKTKSTAKSSVETKVATEVDPYVGPYVEKSSRKHHSPVGFRPSRGYIAPPDPNTTTPTPSSTKQKALSSALSSGGSPHPPVPDQSASSSTSTVLTLEQKREIERMEWELPGINARRQPIPASALMPPPKSTEPLAAQREKRTRSALTSSTTSSAGNASSATTKKDKSEKKKGKLNKSDSENEEERSSGIKHEGEVEKTQAALPLPDEWSNFDEDDDDEFFPQKPMPRDIQMEVNIKMVKFLSQHYRDIREECDNLGPHVPVRVMEYWVELHLRTTRKMKKSFQRMGWDTSKLDK
ncbi:hypothetical protein CI109_100108 [Kwoniella shandongensis]|uniref:Uncharacterized protein n=1 Tax=Kwoniella shandongensis TaxID=1734106 RepID=A0A5M6BMU0_9TREE|nr:uncharacterized protein CI109_007494 [Kwoniella shandongensis]KAA5524194.1 hypothetical protein CI109_007494 [Kwoniella shandongensis]